MESGDNYQAGNEWLDNASSSQYPLHNDIILGPSATPFNYYAHAYLFGNSSLETTDPRKNNIPLIPQNPYLNVCDGTSASLQLQTKDPNSSCIDIFDGWYRPANDGVLSVELLDKLNDLIIVRNNHLSSFASLESQLFNPETQKEIVDKLNYLHKEIRLVNDGIIEIYGIAGNEIAVKSLLESEQNVEAKMKLYAKYIEEKDFTNATRVLNEMLSLYNPDYSFENTNEENKYEDNKNFFAEIAWIERNAASENRKLTELNVSEKQTLQTIVNANLPISAKAEVILAYNGVNLYQRPIKKLSELDMNELLYGNTNNYDYNLTVNPNPASQNIDVCFVLPDNATNVKLKLVDEYNQVGLLLEERSLLAGELCKQFDVSLYQSGTYRILLEHDGQSATGKHLVILR
jgi:hypothetical protein